MRVILIVVLFVVTSLVSAQWVEDGTEAVDLKAAAQWALDRPDAQTQAAGLLLQMAPELDDAVQFVEVETPIDLQVVESILDQTRDPTLLAMVAVACRQSDRMDRCSELGLDELIARHAPGNLILRAAGLDRNISAWQEAILESEYAEDHTMQIGLTVFHALEAYISHEQIDVLPAIMEVQAISLVMSSAMPAYSPLVDACKTGNDAVKARCDLIARSMIESADHLLAQMIGGALLREMATARGDRNEAQSWEQRREDFRSYMTCLSYGIPADHWERDSGLRPNWLEYAAQHGELAQMERLAERYGVQCDMTPAQARSAQVAVADFSEGSEH